jgi:predicted metal-dependent hydrolase
MSSSSEFQISHEGVLIRYRLTVGRSARGVVSLKIRPDGLVLASVPPRVHASAVHRLVREKAGWIAGHLGKLAERPAAGAVHPALRYEDGEPHLFLGQAYPLRVLPHDKVRDKLLLADGELRLFSSQPDAAKTPQVLYRWYARELEALITREIEVLAAGMPWVTEMPTFRLKLVRSRWGSCSGRGNLNFNLHLAKASPEAIRYVVLHELCHLAEMNHSERFWRLVAERMPDWKRHRAYFKTHGALLMRD